MSYSIPRNIVVYLHARGLEAFKLRCYRRMLKESCGERKTNEEVLNMMNVQRSLLGNTKKRKVKYFGNMVRQNGLQFLLEGK